MKRGHPGGPRATRMKSSDGSSKRDQYRAQKPKKCASWQPFTKRSFRSEYDYFSTIFHEFSHSTLHEKRLNRTNAIGQRWGDSAYALEELRAEIASAILSDSTGLSARCSPESMKAHVDNHSAYLRSWIKAIEKDPMAIFSAAKDAELMSEYVLSQERQMTAMAPHKEWVAEYER